MSALSGPSRGRANTRIRGSSRGVARARGTRGGPSVNNVSRRPAFPSTTGAETHLHPKETGKPNHIRNKSWRNSDQSSTGIKNNGGKASTWKSEPWRNASTEDPATYKRRINELFQTLAETRKTEREYAIKNGTLADPEKPTSLANAITPVGTCQDMCPEFERIERITQFTVDKCEKETSTLGVHVPCEALMVKRFRRSGAGNEEPLPSDLRPPWVLKKTLDYLINDVVGGPQPLEAVHNFVWNRTRGIRNDFSIQQVTRTEDLRLAIECFERIARFHILSMHHLSRTDLKDIEFSYQQEFEQLNKTLLSLMYYYDDSRSKLTSPNEAEFRAYCIIFEIDTDRPDIEDRAQGWPRAILKDPKVRTALKLHAAAVNTSENRGPLEPMTPFPVAQANPGRFWEVISSNAVSYATACVAEVYFEKVRKMTMQGIWKAYKGKRGGSTKIEDWTLSDLSIALGLDDEDQTAQFCEDYGFVLAENEKGDFHIDLGSVVGGQIRDLSGRPKQFFSKTLVEPKRLRRSLPAVINGLTASQAQSQGFIEDIPDAEYASDANSESLFVDRDSETEQKPSRSKSSSPLKGEIKAAPSDHTAAASPFQANGIFGQPSIDSNPFSPLPTTVSRERPASPFNTAASGQPGPNLSTSTEIPKFNPFQNKPQSVTAGVSPSTSPFATISPTPINPFQRPSVSQTGPTSNTPRSPAEKQIPTFNFIPPGGDDQTSHAGQQNTSQASSAPAVFGRPSSFLNAPTPKETAAIALSGSINLSPQALSVSNESAKKGTGSWSASTGQSQRPPGATPFEPPKVSFNTSPLFQATSTSPNGAQSTSGESKPETGGAEVQMPLFQRNATPQPWPSTTPKQPFSSTSRTAPTKPAAPLPTSPITQQPLLSASLFPPRESDSVDIWTQPVLINPSEKADDSPSGTQSSPKPLVWPQPSNPITISSDSHTPRILPVKPLNGLAPQSLAKRPDPRPQALDSLTELLMMEDGGLLQQFVEFTVAPIIRSSVIKFQDQKSWARARECRAILLAQKYFRKWKTNAWNLGLKRRAKERRRTLANSIRHSQSPTQKSGDLEASPFAKYLQPANQNSTSSKVSDMPPPRSTSVRKRQSLPAQMPNGDVNGTAISVKASKRKRDDSEASPENEQASTVKRGHKRSSTLGGSTMSAPPNRIARPFRTSVDSGRIGDGTLLGDTLVRQARQLAKPPKSDTTRTDYFKLKAMGIDPDTPFIPATIIRSRATAGSSNNPGTREKRSDDTPGTPPASSAAKSTIEDDEDEAFFASIRSVREAMADSTSWFQSERQSMERSMTPQASASHSPPPVLETPAEARLREIREKGRTPTRTELRQRNASDKSFLPVGFWDKSRTESNLHDRHKEQEAEPSESPVPQSRIMGFAALAEPQETNGWTDEDDGAYSRYWTPQQPKGGSMDDAIEL